MTVPDAEASVDPSVESPATDARDRRLTLLRRGALTVWAAALAVQFAVDGVPFDRLSAFAWVGSLMLAASIGRRGVLTVLVDFGPFVAVLVVYDYLRGFAGRLGMPTLWHPQADVDEWLFGGTSPTVWLQEHLKYAQPRWWDVPVALVYVSYFVMPTIVAGVLWLRSSRRDFRRWALRYVGLCLLAFTFFALLPAAPPWAAGRCTPAQVADHPQDPRCMHVPPGDTSGSLLGALHSPHPGAKPYVQRIAYRGFAEIHLPRAGSLLQEGQASVDLVAAIPSLHSAGVLLFVIFMWRRVKRWWTRALLVVYPPAMTFALVYSGEHYVADVLAGWLVAIVVSVVATRIERWLARRRKPDAAPDTLGSPPAPTQETPWPPIHPQPATTPSSTSASGADSSSRPARSTAAPGRPGTTAPSASS